MKPTPETDLAEAQTDFTDRVGYVYVELARKLERERDEALEEIAAMCATSAGEELQSATATNAFLLQKLERVMTERDALRDHIKSALPGLGYLVDCAQEHLTIKNTLSWRDWITEARKMLHQPENNPCNES